MALLLLAFLAQDGFRHVLDALALVGFRRTIGTNLRRDLPDHLLVGARDGDAGRLLALDLDAVRDRIAHVVAEAELQVELLALDRGPVADAVDLQLLGEAVGHAGHHRLDARPGGAPHAARPLAVVRRLHDHRAIVHGDAHVVGRLEGELAKLALGRDLKTVDADLHAARYRDRVLSYARHNRVLRIRGREPRRRRWRHGLPDPT